VAAGGRATQRGGGRGSVGERRTSAPRRTVGDRGRAEHGVAGASDEIVVAVSVIVAGDTVRAEQSWKPNKVVQCESGAGPPAWT
jgi:hypothetical protein